MNHVCFYCMRTMRKKKISVLIENKKKYVQGYECPKCTKIILYGSIYPEKEQVLNSLKR